MELIRLIDLEKIDYKKLRFLSAQDMEAAMKTLGHEVVICQNCRYNPDYTKNHNDCKWDPDHPHYPGDFCSQGKPLKG